jgi:hypothetical protein
MKLADSNQMLLVSCWKDRFLISGALKYRYHSDFQWSFFDFRSIAFSNIQGFRLSSKDFEKSFLIAYALLFLPETITLSIFLFSSKCFFSAAYSILETRRFFSCSRNHFIPARNASSLLTESHHLSFPNHSIFLIRISVQEGNQQFDD